MHKAAYSYLQLCTIIILLLLVVQRIVRICYGDETCDILSYCKTIFCFMKKWEDNNEQD